ncbi:MAG TPA: hypothetical protein VMT60_01310, partial [Candidatus Bathyarchaeia archaeon]|nr:hypothetical protein [Candidatus Bathyarchaeia archaeon]
GLLALWALRHPVAVVEYRVAKKGRTFPDYLLLAGGLPLYAIAKPADTCVKGLALREWRTRSAERNGSEMHLFFTR